MAWLTRTNWLTGDVPSATEFNNFGLDIRTWGSNVDAAGYQLVNVGAIASRAGVTTVNNRVTISDATTNDTLVVQNSNTIGSLLLLNPTATGGKFWRLWATANGATPGGGKLVILGNATTEVMTLSETSGRGLVELGVGGHAGLKIIGPDTATAPV